MKKNIVKVILAFVLVILSSCTGMIKNAIKDTPIANKIMLHHNPKKGDYAKFKVVYEHTNAQADAIRGTSTTTLKITDISSQTVYIEETFHSTGFGAGFLNGITFKFVTDLDGNVKKCVMIDNGEELNLKIAKKGDEAYNTYEAVSSEDFYEWHIPAKVTVPVGTFETTARYLTKKKDMKKATYAVYLTNPNVKFSHVASYAINKREDGTFYATKALELVEQGNK